MPPDRLGDMVKAFEQLEASFIRQLIQTAPDFVQHVLLVQLLKRVFGA